MTFSDPGYSERHRYLKNLVSGLRDTVQEKKDKLTEEKLGRRARPSAASDRAVLLDQNQPSAAADRAESVDQNQPSTSAALDRAVLVDQNQPSTSAAADRAESVFQNQPSTSAALDKAESVDQVQQSPTESEFMEQDVSDAACDSNVLLNDLLDADLTDGNTDLINDLLNADLYNKDGGFTVFNYDPPDHTPADDNLDHNLTNSPSLIPLSRRLAARFPSQPDNVPAPLHAANGNLADDSVNSDDNGKHKFS